MGYVGNQQTEGFSQVPAKQDLTGATGTSLTLTHAVASAEGIDLFINNVRQEPTTAYSVGADGVTVTLTGSVVATDDIYVVYNSLARQTSTHPSNQALQATSGTFSGDLTVDTNTLYVDSTNNRVGINQAAPAHPLHVGTDDLIVDASGNLLVGKTSADSTIAGVIARPDGFTIATRDGGAVAQFRRLTSDGDIALFYKDGSTVGVVNVTGGAIIFGRGDTALAFNTDLDAVYPINTNGAPRDNAIDLGRSSVRFDDIYATNGTIQTSDANEKQQIAVLTDAEITAAKAISQLFKTFKWNDAVSEKGDAARTHAGVIAQEVEAAMTAAGLNAGDYAFFISSTWYVDVDGNEVEADAEGAIEKNRKGIRYPELLAFVGAATEQRLANIETRLAALEAN
ncbi:MAG: tail fiber domain-containing protein [Alphaproteobacteria bacterium]